jgi:hypothetical protein
MPALLGYLKATPDGNSQDEEKKPAAFIEQKTA